MWRRESWVRSSGRMARARRPSSTGSADFSHRASGTIASMAGTSPDLRRISAVHFGWARIPKSPFGTQDLRKRPRQSGRIRLRPWISRSEQAEIHQRIEDTLKLVGLETKKNRLVGELAHGDRRAAEVAMALALQPQGARSTDHRMGSRNLPDQPVDPTAAPRQ